MSKKQSFADYRKRLDSHRLAITVAFLVPTALLTIIALAALVYWLFASGLFSGSDSDRESNRADEMQTTVAIAAFLLAAYGSTIAIIQLRNAIHHYHGNTKRAMRVATTQHLMETSNRLRDRERRLMRGVSDIAKRGFAADDATMFPARLRKSYPYIECPEAGNDDLDKQLTGEKRDAAKKCFQEFSSLTLDTDAIILDHKHAEFLNQHFHLRSHVRQMLDGLESLGASVARKCYGFVTVNAVTGAQIVDTYRRYEAFIELRRTTKYHNEAYIQFQWLASMIVSYRAIRACDIWIHSKTIDKDSREYMDTRVEAMAARDWISLFVSEQKCWTCYNSAYRDRSDSQLSLVNRRLLDRDLCVRIARRVLDEIPEKRRCGCVAALCEQ